MCIIKNISPIRKVKTEIKNNHNSFPLNSFPITDIPIIMFLIHYKICISQSYNVIREHFN